MDDRTQDIIYAWLNNTVVVIMCVIIIIMYYFILNVRSQS